jgi:hypothetical protein
MWDQKKLKQIRLIASVSLLVGFLKAEEARSLCNIAIAPIETNDAQINKILSTRLQGSIKEKLSTLDSKCENAEFSDYQGTQDAFDRVGVNSFFGRALTSLSKAQLKYVYQELGAIYVVEVIYTRESDLLEAQIFKLFGQLGRIKQTAKLELKKSELISKEDVTPAHLNFLSKLTPNSAVFGITNSDLYFEFEEPWSSAGSEQRRVLPKIVSSVGFEKIEHYRTYSLFDYGGSIFPSSFFFGVDQKENAKNRNTLEERDLYLKAY